MPHEDHHTRPTTTTDAAATSDAARRAERVVQPAEFSFMERGDWLDFHCELYDVVLGLPVSVERVEPGVIRLAGGRSLPLLSLVEQCHARPRDDWHGLIERYLGGLVDLLGGAVPPIEQRLSSFDLRVRLVPSSPLDSGMLAALGARPVAEGIAAVLSTGQGADVRTIGVDELTSLGWDAEAAWASAWEQTKLLEEPDELDVVEIGGIEVVHLFGCSEYTASFACSLEHHLGPLGEHGAIVAMPCDHTVLVHPIEGRESRRAIGTLVPVVRRIHGDGPGSLSPHLYWWRDGRLTWIPTIFGGDTNEVYLPAGLGRALS